MDYFPTNNLNRKEHVNNHDNKRLEHPAVKDYLTNADRRVLVGARFILEALGLPCPAYLDRKPAGRPLAKRIMTEFREDNPESFHQRTMRRSRELTRQKPIT